VRGQAAQPTVALALAAVVAAGCVAFAGPTPGPTPTPAPAPTPSRRPTPTPAPTSRTYRVKPGDTLSGIAVRFGLSIGQLLAANPQITDPDRITAGQVIVIPPPNAPDTGPDAADVVDPEDDVVDSAGATVAGQAYADLTGFAARLASGRLQLRVSLVHAPPPRADPDVETIAYTVVVDTDSDDEPDYRIVYANDVQGVEGFGASIEDLASGRVRRGDEFPGTVVVGERSIRMAVDVRALGAPGTYALAAGVERRFYLGGRDDPEVEEDIDFAPDQQWPLPNPRWIVVSRR
jgi:LysM repeat protein